MCGLLLSKEELVMRRSAESSSLMTPAERFVNVQLVMVPCEAEPERRSAPPLHVHN